jgi:hypothetical protein
LQFIDSMIDARRTDVLEWSKVDIDTVAAVLQHIAFAPLSSRASPNAASSMPISEGGIKSTWLASTLRSFTRQN